MNDREKPSGLETTHHTIEEGQSFCGSLHGALIAVLVLLVISFIIHVDMPRLATLPVQAEEAVDLRLDLNTATQAELESLPNIGPLKAKRIMGGRPFHSAHDLLRVQGLGPKTLESLLPHIKVSAEEPKPD